MVLIRLKQNVSPLAYLDHNCLNLPDIMKTCLYNFDPLKSHFYIVKLGVTGVYIIFLIFAQKHSWGGSNEYPQSMFWTELRKISAVFIWKVSFFGSKISNIFEQACLRNASYGYRIYPMYLDTITPSGIVLIMNDSVLS